MQSINRNRGNGVLIFRVLGLLVGAAALALQAIAHDRAGGGFMIAHNLAYFTIQTNLFGIALFGFLIVKTLRAGRTGGGFPVASAPPVIHAGCAFYITVTMLGYWVGLVPALGLPKAPVLLASTLFLHTFAPLWVIADFLLFGVHGRLKRKDVLKWLIYPLLYLASIILIAQVITEPYYTVKIAGETIPLWYPYPFIEPQIVGVGGMIAASALLCGLFAALGAGYVALDHRLAAK